MKVDPDLAEPQRLQMHTGQVVLSIPNETMVKTEKSPKSYQKL